MSVHLLQTPFVCTLLSGATAAMILALLEGTTDWGPAIMTMAAMIGASFFTFLAVVAKLRYDRWKEKKRDESLLRSTETDAILRRDQLVAQQFDKLLVKLQEMHVIELKQKEAVIVMQRELAEQARATVSEQRELIAQQAAMIVKMKDPARQG